MNKQKLQLLFNSFQSRKELTEFKNKIRIECDLSYPSIWNYTSVKATPVPKLVAEKIMEIVNRDYPEKAELLNQFEEVI